MATELASTLFVEAGAGSGKTSALVERVLALVTEGGLELGAVAAITFTEKAAHELRDRLRRELERRAEAAPGTAGAARCRAALDDLDGAAIGTLHSFAQRLLGEHPVEAGLPPRVEVLDEVSSRLAFEQRWLAFRDELLADPDFERALLLLFAAGARPEALRSLALAFDDNWDLVEAQVPPDAPDPPPVAPLVSSAAGALRRACEAACGDPNGAFGRRLDELAAWARRLEATTDELDLLEALDPAAMPSLTFGRKGRRNTADVDAGELERQVRQAAGALEKVRNDVVQACAHRVAAAIRRFTVTAAEDRRRSGRLMFHDLLVLARALLRSPEHGPSVRARLHARYRRLLLDEFQDTDPIQVELAVRIAAADPEGKEAGSAPWDQVEVSPGHLFFVGDPKQSIYRFRRADIATFLAAGARFGGEKGRTVQLTANFRSTAPIVEWVNTTFGALMDGSVGTELPVPSQPRFASLVPTRDPPGTGAPVAVLGREPHPGTVRADELRAAEAGAVAAAVVRIVDEGWEVDDGLGGWRPARCGDIAVLVPARTSLPFLEGALERAGVAFRTESSSLVYATRAVRDLLAVLRAVDDPTASLLVVAALRTPLLGCGDDDLFRFRRQRGGRWDYLGEQPATVPEDDPVRSALAYLRSLHDQRHWLSPAELLGKVARDRRAFELGFVEARPRDVWRRLRFVIDQARAFGEATDGNLRQFLAWVDHQAAEGVRTTETVLAEHDDDAVRIMTIHGAKGLEFPIVIVSGMSSAPRTRVAPAEVVFTPGGVGYRFGSRVRTEAFEAWAPVEEQMDLHERIRLLYVACTRARDHLVVSLHRKQRQAGAPLRSRTAAELLVEGMGTLVAALPDADGPERARRRVPPELPAAIPPFEAWAAERAESLERAGRPRVVAATALSDEGGPERGGEPDAGLRKRPRDLDLPPWLKGRYGTAVGRAVHGVLQTIDLATGRGLQAAVAAQCEAEAVPERTGDVATLVEAALGSPSVREAASRPHWREVYVCTPVGDRLLEGYVDLLYRTRDGLVVVDYKTAATADPAELARRLERYRNQGGAYALGVAGATGEPVVRVAFVFLTPAGALEAHMADLEAAVAAVREAVAAGQEIVVD